MNTNIDTVLDQFLGTEAKPILFFSYNNYIYINSLQKDTVFNLGGVNIPITVIKLGNKRSDDPNEIRFDSFDNRSPTIIDDRLQNIEHKYLIVLTTNAIGLQVYSFFDNDFGIEDFNVPAITTDPSIIQKPCILLEYSTNAYSGSKELWLKWIRNLEECNLPIIPGCQPGLDSIIRIIFRLLINGFNYTGNLYLEDSANINNVKYLIPSLMKNGKSLYSKYGAVPVKPRGNGEDDIIDISEPLQVLSNISVEFEGQTRSFKEWVVELFFGPSYRTDKSKYQAFYSQSTKTIPQINDITRKLDKVFERMRISNNDMNKFINCQTAGNFKGSDLSDINSTYGTNLGNIYHNKYLKYKYKYLNIKNSLY